MRQALLPREQVVEAVRDIALLPKEHGERKDRRQGDKRSYA
ncbi:MAG: hypothetical protein ACREX4_07490 [Gammaproteobacteria bacterium]